MKFVFPSTRDALRVNPNPSIPLKSGEVSIPLLATARKKVMAPKGMLQRSVKIEMDKPIILQYTIVEVELTQNLPTLVNKYLAAGWSVVGAPYVLPARMIDTGISEVKHCQAMTSPLGTLPPPRTF
jgi:hypothetical protein